MKKAMCLVVVGLISGAGVWAEEMAMPAIKISTELKKIQSLAGTWVGTSNSTHDGERQTKVVYEVTSGGSAVVEKLGAGTSHEMVSVYHDKGGKLSMTHYCMLGNQPEMDLTGATDTRYELKEPADGPLSKEMHMNTITIEWLGPAAIRQTWTAVDAEGKAQGPTVIELKKA